MQFCAMQYCRFSKWCIIRINNTTMQFCAMQYCRFRDAAQKKKRDFLGIFPKGGGVFAIPKTILYLPFHFLYAETWKFWGGPVFPKVKTGSFLGGHLFPKLLKSKIDQKVNIFVKTKNAPKGLKCKINQTFFFENTGSQKGGRGGVRHLGKIPKKSRFFYGERP